MTLKYKSLHQLRGIAQSYSIPDIFSKDSKRLIQEIELKQTNSSKPDPISRVLPTPQYDARLMTKPPAKKSDESSIRDLLSGYVDQGLHLSFDQERWYMGYNDKTDEGTLRMPLRVVLRCAEKLMA